MISQETVLMIAFGILGMICMAGLTLLVVLTEKQHKMRRELRQDRRDTVMIRIIMEHKR